MLLSASVLSLGTSADAITLGAPISGATLAVGNCGSSVTYNTTPASASSTYPYVYIISYFNGVSHYASSGFFRSSPNSATGGYNHVTVAGVTAYDQAFLQTCGLTNIQNFSTSSTITAATTIQSYGDLYVRFRATEQGVEYDYDLTVSANGATRATKIPTGGVIITPPNPKFPQHRSFNLVRTNWSTTRPI